MPDHPALSAPPTDLIAQIMSELASMARHHGWSFTVGHDTFSIAEVTAPDGLLPMLLYRVQWLLVSSGRDLHAWDRMAYESEAKGTLCGAVPVPGNPTYSAKDWVLLITRWIQKEGSKSGLVQNLDKPYLEWMDRFKAKRGPFIVSNPSTRPLESEASPEPAHGVVRLALEAGLMNAARFLLEGDADVDQADMEGFTALHWSAQQGITPAVHLLLEHGARVDALTRAQQTPALLAAAGDHLDAFKALVDAGANLTALDVAKVAGPQVQAILSSRQPTSQSAQGRGSLRTLLTGRQP